MVFSEVVTQPGFGTACEYGELSWETRFGVKVPRRCLGFGCEEPSSAFLGPKCVTFTGFRARQELYNHHRVSAKCRSQSCTNISTPSRSGLGRERGFRTSGSGI